MYKYCLHCEKIQKCTPTHPHNIHYCITCKKGLIYFGRESVKLSSPSILKLYDETHAFNTKKHAKKPINYILPQPNMQLLECEDILKHQPDNDMALIFLTTYYWSINNISEASYYMKRLQKYFPKLQKTLTLSIDIHMSKNEYEDALHNLLKLSVVSSEKDLIAYHYGVIYAAQKKFKLALPYFYKANKNTEKKHLQEKTKQILAYLNLKLENS